MKARAGAHRFCLGGEGRLGGRCAAPSLLGGEGEAAVVRRAGFRLPSGESETLRLSPHAKEKIKTARNADNVGRLSVFRSAFIFSFAPGS